MPNCLSQLANQAEPTQHGCEPKRDLLKRDLLKHHPRVRRDRRWRQTRTPTRERSSRSSLATDRPKYLLISMAVTDQLDRVVEIVKTAQALPPNLRPKIFVGGYPVKAGPISAIPAAELLADISALRIS